MNRTVQVLSGLALPLLVACTSDDKETTVKDTPDAQLDSGSKAPDAGKPVTHPSVSVSATANAPDASVPPGVDCPSIIACVDACTTEACIETCDDDAPASESDNAADLLVCSITNECADEDCVVDNCAEEFLICLGVSPSPEPGADAGGADAGGADGGIVGDGGVVLGCPELTGDGTEHQGFIQADETWTAAGSPHIITSSVSVRGATLTIEPCAVVVVNEGYSITVGESSGDAASLIAHGELDGDIVRPVRITSAAEGEYWGGLIAVTTGSVDLEYTILERGGHPDGHGYGYASTLSSHGDDNRETVIQNLSAKHILIQDSASLGISLEASGGFTDDSTDVVVTGGGSEGRQSANIQTTYPVYVEAPAIHTLPEGEYTGNAQDAILAYASFAVTVDEAFHDLGVPYQIVSKFYMRPEAGTGPSTLTIDPGVTLMLGGEDFPTDPRILLGDTAFEDQTHEVILLAEGTSAKPILFTSGASVPAAGDWTGIVWSAAPATGSAINHVTIEYAGADSQTTGFGCGPGDTDALLSLFWEPTEAFIKNSTFRFSRGGGIVSGWDSDAASPDLKTTNTFADIGNACEISVHQSADDACPDNDGNPSCY